jgi:toxin FitB
LTFLLDTNVISEVRRPNGDVRVKEWLASVHGDDLYVSVLLVGEIKQGIERLRPRDPIQATSFEVWLGRLRSEFADRILVISEPIAEEWGRLNALATLPVIDGLLAATAIVHRLTLVTRNTRDVARTGVSLLNPFEQPRSTP